MGEGHGHDTEGAKGDHVPPGGRDGGSRPLGPSDVRNQVFTVVRLREGYDLSEVNGFLGRVEHALDARSALDELREPGHR